MGNKPERKWNLYAASFFVAVMAALVGFGAAMTNQSAPQSHAAPERTVPAYQPGPAQSSAVTVAQPEDPGDRAVYMYY